VNEPLRSQPSDSHGRFNRVGTRASKVISLAWQSQQCFRWSVPDLLWAASAVIHPFLHRSDKIRAVERRRCTSVTRIPAPANKIVGRNVREDLRETAAAVLLRVLQLAAKLSGSPAHKNHFHLWRRQPPFRIPRRHVRARKIRALVARLTPHPIYPMTISAPLYILCMHMTVVALQRSVARWMAILAARRNENRVGAFKCRLRRRVVWRGCCNCRNKRALTPIRKCGSLGPCCE